MKKIGIITIHYGVNYGSVLQAYALRHFLSNQGFDVEVINYIPERYRTSRKISLRKNDKIDIVRFTYDLLTYTKKKKSLEVFDSFLSEKCDIGEELYTSDALTNKVINKDAVIVGSDQVWNSDYNRGLDSNYYLSFVPENIRKIAYAASCGKDNYSDDEWEQMIDLLSDFYSISLRESNMVEIFNKRGISSSFVCDPVFLLSKREWKEIFKSTNIISERYLLIYCLDSDKNELIRIGKMLAKKLGLKTVLISYYSLLANKDVDYSLEGCEPRAFLSLVSQASYIVTNSFHGVAFSILFNKQFIVTKRKNYNSRITSLLNAFEIIDRYVELGSGDIIRKEIDYLKVEDKKKIFVEKSKQFLLRSINERDEYEFS